MKENLATSDQLTTLLMENYDLVRKSKTGFAAKRIQLLIACLFTGKNETINLEDFSELNQQFKKALGSFTALTTNTRVSIAGLLLADAYEEEDLVSSVIQNYQMLIGAGFKRTEYTYFAAYLLLKYPPEERQQLASRAREIYQLIRKDHPFLTGTEDVTSAVLLAGLPSEEKPEAIAARNEYYFQQFADIGLKKENSLQFLAATATCLYPNREKNFIQQYRRVYRSLKEKKIRVKPLHYVTLGILTFLTQGEPATEELEALIQQIRVQKGLRFEGAAFQTALALSLYTEQRVGEMSQAQIESLMISVHVLIAIEQAAAVSAAAAASAAAASSSSS
ncbi:DUF4003 family protein [Listeria costaricensis]|uniref:DUF4003 family protein n=1 Tax=Listeria costaricensis TaxID=2026604 RepID=UPI000C06B1FE|nr:DUF4003 family protein [Listeria costaricensis]